MLCLSLLKLLTQRWTFIFIYQIKKTKKKNIKTKIQVSTFLVDPSDFCGPKIQRSNEKDKSNIVGVIKTVPLSTFSPSGSFSLRVHRSFNVNTRLQFVIMVNLDQYTFCYSARHRYEMYSDPKTHNVVIQ